MKTGTHPLSWGGVGDWVGWVGAINNIKQLDGMFETPRKTNCAMGSLGSATSLAGGRRLAFLFLSLGPAHVDEQLEGRVRLLGVGGVHSELCDVGLSDLSCQSETSRSEGPSATELPQTGAGFLPPRANQNQSNHQLSMNDRRLLMHTKRV